MGNPGGGKTSTVAFLGKTLGVPTEIRSGNKADPTDFSGIPYLEGGENGAGKTLKFSEPKYVQIMKGTPNGILFFDEITTCSPAIQVALLSIIQDCQFGEFEIPKTIYRVAAGNYNNITGTHNMSSALMNRFCHIFYNMDIGFFTDGFLSEFKNYEEAAINSAQEQINKGNKYRLAVVNFVKEHPEYLDAFPQDGAVSDVREFVYPTPRLWEMAVKILSALDGNDASYVSELVTGCIGEAAGGLFAKFVKDFKGLEIDIPSFVGKEKEFRLPYPDRHDHVSQIMNSMVYYIEHEPAKYMALWLQVINVLHNKGGAYGVYASYDNLIMKYLHPNIKHFLATKTISGEDLNKLKERIPCWNLLHITAEEKYAGSRLW